MSRNPRSAKAAGAWLERSLADHLAKHVDDRIDRRVKTGAKDRGDLASVRTSHGGRVVVEVKNCIKINLGTWANEAEIERRNDDAIAGVVAHKRHGKAKPGEQWVTMTVDDLIAILTGTRPQ